MISTRPIRLFLTVVLLANGAMAQVSAQDARLNGKLRRYVKELSGEFTQIEPERRAQIEELADEIVREQALDGTARLLFICTHNSRRSHMAQAWATAAAAFYGVEGTDATSGGTEATAFNPRAVAALERAGFRIVKQPGVQTSNPVYLVQTGRGLPSFLAYSKVYSDPSNPQTDFFAVMVCSDADRSCPLVDGSDGRFAIPYEDPKASDNTPSEELQYDLRCRQIAREMFFLMEQVKRKNVAAIEGSAGN